MVSTVKDCRDWSLLYCLLSNHRTDYMGLISVVEKPFCGVIVIFTCVVLLVTQHDGFSCRYVSPTVFLCQLQCDKWVGLFVMTDCYVVCVSQAMSKCPFLRNELSSSVHLASDLQTKDTIEMEENLEPDSGKNGNLSTSSFWYGDRLETSSIWYGGQIGKLLILVWGQIGNFFILVLGVDWQFLHSGMGADW